MQQKLRKILANIIAIKSDNLFLQYIIERIQDDNYRGLHVSQHNRYDLDRLVKILQGIRIVANTEIFRVPLGDDGGVEQSDCGRYYQIVKEVKRLAGIGTINSLKKNFFVDFHGAGLLFRFDKNRNLIDRNGKRSVHHAQLTPLAISLLDAPILGQYKAFTVALDNLFSDELTKLAEILYYSDYKDTYIESVEFTLILSDNRRETGYDKIELLDAYRALKRPRRKKALNLIKKYCTPDNFTGNKTRQRDFGNWKNQTQQIFSLLKSTVYFDVYAEKLKLNIGTYGIFDVTQAKRSQAVKSTYFREHQIEKTETFELHHIVPFSAAKNKEEFKLIDHWKNLIYLKNTKHAEITQNRNQHVILDVGNKVLHFINFDNHRITATHNDTACYAEKRCRTMRNHNKILLSEVYGLNTSID